MVAHLNYTDTWAADSTPLPGTSDGYPGQGTIRQLMMEGACPFTLNASDLAFPTSSQMLPGAQLQRIGV